MNRIWKTGVNAQAMTLVGSPPFSCAGHRFGCGVIRGVAPGAGVGVGGPGVGFGQGATLPLGEAPETTAPEPTGEATAEAPGVAAPLAPADGAVVGPAVGAEVGR